MGRNPKVSTSRKYSVPDPRTIVAIALFLFWLSIILPPFSEKPIEIVKIHIMTPKKPFPSNHLFAFQRIDKKGYAGVTLTDNNGISYFYQMDPGLYEITLMDGPTETQLHRLYPEKEVTLEITTPIQKK